MELTILGKYGPYGKAGGGAASGYLVRNGESLLVLDMGSGTMSRLTGLVDVRKINAIFISHLHFDHTSDLLPFRYLLEDLEHKVTIYTHYEDSDWYRVLFNHPSFNIVNIDESTVVSVGNMELSFRKMEHTATDYAVKIKGEKTLCYTGDTLYNDNIEWCFEGSDMVLMDCSKPSGTNAPHMTVDDAKKLADAHKGTVITATHQSVDYDPANELSEYKNIICAEELKEYTI